MYILCFFSTFEHFLILTDYAIFISFNIYKELLVVLSVKLKSIVYTWPVSSKCYA